MEIKDKNILVVGLGITGISIIKVLSYEGANIFILDSKKEEDIIDKVDDIKYKGFFGGMKIDLLEENIDLIIKSPGVPPNLEVFKQARNYGIKVVTDIELAYRIMDFNKIISITGTNGKTTITSIIDNILKEDKTKHLVAGNIGKGILDYYKISDKKTNLLLELSSFQLSHIEKFKPDIAVISNLSKDHLDWHITYENYIESKFNIFKNQDKNDYLILNYNDKLLKKLKDKKANIYWFSLDSVVPQGAYLYNDKLYLRDGSEDIYLLTRKDINLIGEHNVENVLASVIVAYLMGINPDIIKKGIMNFKSVEHRIEYVTEIDNISFINDSKGTNIQSTIKAIESFDKNLNLIIGGYDRGDDFSLLFKNLNNKVKNIFVMGETQEKIMNIARNFNFCNIYKVKDMGEAVKKSYELSNSGDYILLSPACASWDMYENFELRGIDFKNKIKKLKDDINEK